MKTKTLLTAILIFMIFNGVLFSQTFPSGFSQVKVADVTDATAMTFAPDGRIFVCQRDGTVKIVKNGVLLSTPFVKLTTDQNGERGVSGITFDPNFYSNHYLYIYYTAASPTIHNRLSRFTANGDVAVAGSEHVLIDAETVTQIYHNGGGLGFGPDGKLYLSMGEDNKPSNSQSLTTYKGKLLRFNPDGSTPSDNPYASSSDPITQKIWCMGLRNPYTLSIQPGTGRIFVNNVGSDYWEEIHDGTHSGQNFGWPDVEGYGTNPAYVNPIFAYPHQDAGQHGCAITGGTFFNPPSTNYPSQYTGKYFYMEFCNGWIYYLTPGTTSYTNNTLFATGLTTQNLALQVGTDGNLYYLNRYGTKAGVWKIVYSNNNAPVITNQPDNLTVAAGQPATFSVSASGATPMSYQWMKNGTNISGATSATYTISSTTSSSAGQYSVKVSNTYGSVTSNSATLTITTANDRPVATIITPGANTYYHGGDVISFSGNATDAQDGTLPASKFTWTVEFWHNNNHYHPGPYIPPGVKSGTFTIPNTGELSPNVFYRLKLKVTDNGGLIDTQHVDIYPLKSTITLNSVPTGLQVTYDGQPKTTPFSIEVVRGMIVPLGVISPQTKDGISYTFDHWSQGGAASQSVTIGDNNPTYTAYFNAGTTSGSCSATGTITRDFWANVHGTTLADVPFNTTPTSTTQLNIFEGPANVGDNYGSRIRGYICPPVTGSYTFWISSDDYSELWLSTNDNPANKVKIASVSGWTAVREWTKYHEQQSHAVTLTAGNKYFIEALHREIGQGDHIEVGWQLPNGTMERPIPGSRLASFSASSGSIPTVSITSPANNTTFSNPSNIIINANAASAGGTITKVEFYNGTTKIGEDVTAPFSYTWMNVTSGSYALKARAINNTGQVNTSAAVNIIVGSCPTPIITPSGPTTMCSGTVTLRTAYISGNMYQWKKDGVDISGATAYAYTASVTGSYQVKVIQGSCVSWSAPMDVKIQNGLSASITAGGPTTFCQGGNVKLYANTCSGYTYQWRKDGVDIAGATASTYTVYNSGKYQIRITQSGVNAWSAQVTVMVNPCRETESEEITDESASTDKTDQQQEEEQLKEQTVLEGATPDTPPEKFEMKVYPNPNNGLFTIMLNMPAETNEKIVMRIVNMLGQEIYTKEFVTREDYIKETVELDNSLQTGIYTLQVTMGNKVENTSIVLSR